MNHTEDAKNALILIGCDYLFLESKYQKQLMTCFHDVLFAFFQNKQKEDDRTLDDMCFGC